MFYIEKFSKLNRREITLMHVLPAVIVFGAFFGITAWNYLQMKHTLQNNQKDILVKNVQSTSGNINRNVLRYEDILNASAGLFESSEYVSGDEWNRFVDIFDLAHRYEGVRTMGFAKSIPASDQESFINQVRSKEHSDYNIFPKPSGLSSTPVVYTQPKLKNTVSIIGYDMFSNPRLRLAMEQARDTGEPTITSGLEQGTHKTLGDIPGFVIFSPVYQANAGTDSIAQRRQHIFGYVYAAVSSYSMLSQFYDSSDESFAFQIHDSNNHNGQMFYQTPNYSTVSAEQDSDYMSQEFGVNNRRWVISASESSGAISARDRQRPATSLWSGVLFSVFLAIFIYMLLANRTRAMGEQDEKKIQSAKDELLALASHQLRTPATGVKQYIGMLMQGYGGKLSREQKKFLEQAYESNERQLNTINDMLFVARADTGDIKFTFEKTDLLDLIRDILNEQAPSIKENKLKLLRKLESKPVYVNGDPRYLRMAVENLISNATKYTEAGGKITVSLKKSKTRATIKVEDTGVGIPKKYHYLLFNKFSRVPNSLTGKVSGTGIGLYLAKKVVVAHKGRISLRSSDRDGSVFIISLPLL